MKMNNLDIDVLRKYLNYDPSTGDITWRINKCSAKEGSIAGHVKPQDGYRYVKLNRSRILAHRAAWALYYGAWPNKPLDHINMDRSDNRISNLRVASVTENNRNRTKQSNNTSGFKGVSFHKNENKFHARICVDKKRISLGYFDTAEEAHATYIKASEELHGKFSRH